MTIRHAPITRRGLLRTGAAIGAGALAAGALPRAAFASTMRSWPTVDALLSGYVEGRKVANMVAMMGQGQHAPVSIAHGRLGLLRDTLADSNSLYRIYSMTKPVTGMAAMILVDEGKLQLDQPLADILPAFAEMQVQREYDGAITEDNLEPAVRPITIRHLLTHTAGFGYNIVQQGALAKAYMENGIVPGAISRAAPPGAFGGKPAASLEAFAEALAELPLVYQPGTRWSYSVSLDLLGRVIEVVSGQPFDEFLMERIIVPTGMVDTGFQVAGADIPRLTDNYFLAGDTLIPVDLAGNSVYLDRQPFPYGGAGLASTPRDYDRFLQMLAGYGAIEGKRVMSAKAVALGTSDLFPDTMDPADSFMANYGHGAGGRVGKGATKGEYGWFGAAGTSGLVNLTSGLRFSLYTQYMPAQAYDLNAQFQQAVYADYAAAGSPAA
ncbi:serine hydrolase domain-containing protein [Paraurantiacibacter namhicola]|uniref:Esterase EstB n=1 Tax=Paraurantiacibacter namhicola TaxID=645517 RepID=A0A1C7D7T8_9SPHN|nr:serine hydrolase domain-containing protein [Paraurantiacibacter namhicola]ANU07549.1 Esterase EstB [Paraurantiacibacter namhicola]